MIKCFFFPGAVTIEGHANYQEYGKDIVCSAVSMLGYAICNQLQLINSQTSIEISDGKIVISWKQLNEQEQLLIETLKNGLLMVANDYQEHIIIEEVANA